MKTLVHTLGISLCCCCLSLNAQEADSVQGVDSIKVIPADFSVSTGKPLLFAKNSILRIEADSVYVMNPIRYKFYRDLHQSIFSTDSLSDACRQVIKSYEQSLTESQKMFDALLENYDKAHNISIELVDRTQASLVQTEKTLELTQIALRNASFSLDQANKSIKQKKWNSIAKKLLVGAGGVGVGVLIGVLAAH